MRAAISITFALALLVVAVSVATAVTKPGPISVTATLTHSVTRAAPPLGRESDGQEQAWRITDRNGRTIGRMLLRCRWILRAARLCDGELAMPEGKIMFAGSSPTAFEAEYAVTGGTGSYSGAGGVALFNAIGLRKLALRLNITE